MSVLPCKQAASQAEGHHVGDDMRDILNLCLLFSAVFQVESCFKEYPLGTGIEGMS